jgi:nitrous oxidase accessory protein NosD
MLVRFIRGAGCAVGVAAGLVAGPACAAAVSFVSSAGVDAGVCDKAATPCKTLAYALTKTSPGGEIKTLLPGDYGPAIINRGVTLTGVPGALVMAAPNAVGLNILVPNTESVVISGFTINGSATASIGVKVARAAQVIMRDCTIKNFKNWGIELVPSGATKFSIEGVFIANVTYGVYLHRAGSGSPSGVIHRSTLIGNGGSGIGVAVMGQSTVRVSESLIGHFDLGVYAGGDRGDTLRLTRNTISQNNTGVLIEKGLLAKAETAKDNFIAGNTAEDVGGPASSDPLVNVGTQ